MNFEVKVQMPKIKPVIFNFDELKSDLTTALADFENRVYTEDTIAEAKEDRAKLNKLKKAINDQRIAREKESMQPFNEFKAQAKELCDMIDTASSGIGEQLEAFNQKRLAEKTSHIQSLFNDVASNYDIPFITLEKVMNDKWLNKPTSDKAIVEEITAVFEKAIKDLEVITGNRNIVQTDDLNRRTRQCFGDLFAHIVGHLTDLAISCTDDDRIRLM